MPNQSIVSLPPNVEEPVVLRRFLARLVEKLDVLYGNRASTEATKAVSVDELQKALAVLLRLVEETKEDLEDLVKRLQDKLKDVEDIRYKLSSDFGIVVNVE